MTDLFLCALICCLSFVVQIWDKQILPQLGSFKAALDYIWAATWQNQQNGWASSEDSDQHGHPPSLIIVFAVRMKLPTERTAMTLIRLGGCPGWSESSLGAYSFCWLIFFISRMSQYVTIQYLSHVMRNPALHDMRSTKGQINLRISGYGQCLKSMTYIVAMWKNLKTS